MLGEFLLGVLGNGAYDTAKRAAVSLLGEPTDERTTALYAALDSAARQFFDRFGTSFGKPAQSFLARQANWDVIVNSVFYSAPPLASKDFDRRGFDGTQDATQESVAYLVDAVENEMRKHWELDKVLSEKASLRKLDRVADLVQALSGKRPDEGVLQVKDPDKPEGWSPARDTLYTSKLENGATIRYMLRADGVNVEYVFPDGAIAYYDVDNNGNVRDYKSPYPLEDYKVIIDPDMVLSTEQEQLNNGLTRTVVRMKWGRRVETIVDEAGQLKHFHSSSSTHVNHEQRVFVILPPEEGK